MLISFLPKAWNMSITDFNRYIQQLESKPKDNEIEGDIRNPSLLANFWPSLFPVHPIPSHPTPQHGPRPKYFEDGCAFCRESFLESKSIPIAQLHCAHLFHLACILEHWDQPGTYRTNCALCHGSRESE